MADEVRADGTQPSDDESNPGVPEVPARAPSVPPPPPEPLVTDESREAKAPEPEPSDSERPAAETRSREPKESKRRFETLLPGLIRRGIEKSIEAGLSTFEKSLETGRETTGAVREATEAVREAFGEVKAPRDVAHAVGKALTEAKLPREIASAVFTQLDDTKNDVLRIIAKEFRDFLEATDLAGEIKNALTSLSFEVRTEVRFIPNDAGTGVKADVRSQTRVKRTPMRERERRRGRHRTRQPPPDYYDEDEE